jgi:RND family efflux transporter MFP subunit
MEPSHTNSEDESKRMSSKVITLIAGVLILLFAAIFLLGYLPRRQRTKATAEAARREARGLPVVIVATARESSKTVALVLPGNIQPITEAPILARAEGYLVKRYADIGDRVKAGQLLAELATPELDEQVEQGQATLQQVRAALTQANANLLEAKANANLAQITAKRNSTLVARGVLSQQEGDQSNSTYLAQAASVQAAEANINAAQQNIGASEANLRRLTEMQGFKKVRAPFDGIVTVRAVDTGALITTGSTLLFRIAQTKTLRIFINVPQTNYLDLHVGDRADINVQELPGCAFAGRVSRISGSLDTGTRTMLTEIEIHNRDNTLRPGMYAEVKLVLNRSHPPVVVPGEAVVTRSDGIFAAVLDGNNTVHFETINLGRDYGQEVEVASGLRAGDRVVINPSDEVIEGVRVKPTPYQAGSTGRPGKGRS